MPTNPKGYMQAYLALQWVILRRKFGDKCQLCNGALCHNVDLEFAHIKPTKLKGMSRGMYNRIKDIEKNPDCYSLMGKMCHRKHDATSQTIYQFHKDYCYICDAHSMHYNGLHTHD